MKERVTLVTFLIMTAILWYSIITPIQAQPPGWSGDSNLAFQLKMNGVSIADSNSTNPIQVDPQSDLIMQLTIETGDNINLWSGQFVMEYLSIPLINQGFDFDVPIPSGITQSLMNETLPLGSMLSVGGISLVTGTIVGRFSFVYSLISDPGTNITVSDDFVLQLGQPGFGAIMSVTGLITVGFTLMSVFGLLFAFDDFQQGIFAARKMRRGKSPSGVGIFPKSVVLRRKPKKDGEKISQDELKRRVSQAARSAWDKKRCPKCGKKWKTEAVSCSKCKLEASAAENFFSEDIAEYAPKALKTVAPKSKVPVGTFSKRLKLKPDKGGALAAALTDMGIFQTKSIKVPLKKVAFSGMTIAGTYWSWMQLLSGAIPSMLDVVLTTAAGLVVSVIIGYFMYWLARVPKMGYEN